MTDGYGVLRQDLQNLPPESVNIKKKLKKGLSLAGVISYRIHTKNCTTFNRIRFSTTIYQECDFTDCTKMYIPCQL